VKVELSEHVLCPLCVLEFETQSGVFRDKSSRRNVLDGKLIEGNYTTRTCCRCGSECHVVATFKQPEGADYPCDGKSHVTIGR
jgi:hypothetical protein